MSDEKYTNVILEEMNSKFDLLFELISPLLALPVAVSKLQDDMSEVKSDIKIIRRVVKDHSKALQSHEYRITRLETS